MLIGFATIAKTPLGKGLAAKFTKLINWSICDWFFNEDHGTELAHFAARIVT